MAEVRLTHVKKIYDGKKKEKVEAVVDFSLQIKDSEFVVLVGPSGCGKTTTLRMIAGLEDITEGEVYIDGRKVNDVEPKDRNIAFVFQNYALYPHMTVEENIGFALKLKKVTKKVIANRVQKVAEILGISDCLKRKPKTLSGGQQQRVAIGRAIVREPKVLLMDEPLSNLDAKLRNQMRAELLKLRQKINTTIVYVTHDQTEAMTLGDRIVVMDHGKIQQVGTPEEVYHEPANLFVAGFIGSPHMNIFPGNVLGKNLLIGVRPEHLYMVDDENRGNPAMVEMVEMMGSQVHIHLNDSGNSIIMILSANDYFHHHFVKAGDPIRYSYAERDRHFFDGEAGENLLIK